MYTLLATGDLMLQRPLVRPDASGVQRIVEAFRAADYVFTNLEVVLTTREQAADKLVCLRADPSLASSLVDAGITVASVANNHAADFGLDGLYDTMSALEGADVAHVGGGRDLESAYRPARLVAGATGVAFLGVACTLPNGCGAGPARGGITPVRVLSRFVVDPVTIDEDPGMAPFVETVAVPEDVDRAVRAVRQAREAADLVVVGLHWGVPHGWVARFQSELATYQQPLAHALIDAGADAVIGHHPHVLHGVEVYRGKPIFYSLGNFVFHSFFQGPPRLGRSYPSYRWDSLRSDLNRDGGVAALTWGGPGSTLSRAELWIVRLDESGEPSFGSPERSRAAIERVAALSRTLGTEIQVSEGRHGPVGLIMA